MKEFLERISNLSPKRLALLAAQLQSKLDALESQRAEPIAIVGMSCRFPGGADTPEAFWQLLQDGVDAITEVPSSKWDVDALYDPDPETPGKVSTRWGGFLKDVDQFDAHFFGIAPREAASMDPQQRLLLELSWEALERAGQSPDQLMGTPTGVFVGISGSDYFHLQLDRGLEDIDAYLASGNAHSIASGRLSYVLGLQGPSFPVDTACSSSLVAIHLAVQSLRNGECRQALAGGVNLILSPETTVTLSKSHMMANDGRCKTFDARANGFVRGEGGGIVFLKRLSDAVADGDSILALIRGSAVNQDGRSNGLTAPNGPSQEAVIRAALANSGVKPEQISYIETHGTGTSLGDPIEVQALGAVLGQDRAEPVMLGSVKTNIGHLESAAGIAGLIKVVLALQYGEIPPHLHLQEPNPLIPWNELPVTIPTVSTPWQADNGRFAGVSSFGFSGTNAHIVLSDALPAEQKQVEVERPLHLLTLSAKSETALAQLIARMVDHLSHREENVADLAYTANTGRAHFNQRLAITAASTTEIREKLEAFTAGKTATGMEYGQVQGTRQPRVAFLFTGQGAQYGGMARQLYETQPTFRNALDKCNEVLQPYLEQPLLSVIFAKNEDDAALINETAYTQPALFSVEYALAKLWQSWGIQPSVVVGHSVGEYAAACVAGVFSLEDGLKLIAERGRLIQQLPHRGAMAAVFSDEATIAEAIDAYTDDVSIAAINGPGNTVISGTETAVSAILETLADRNIKFQRLTVSHAFHSPLMEPILEKFEQVAASVTYAPPKIGLISNVSGKLTTAAEVTHAAYWRRHVRQPVRFADAIQTLHEQGYEIFVEIGPGTTLLSMGQRCLSQAGGTWLPSLRQRQDDWQQMLNSLAALYSLGVNVDWNSFDQDYTRRKLVLPTYPFQRERYWLEPVSRRADTWRQQSENNTNHPLLGWRLGAAIKETIFESLISLDLFPFLADHRIHGLLVLPSPAYLEMALAAAAEHFGPGSHGVEDLVIHEALVLSEDESRTVQTVLTSQDAGVSVHIFSRYGNEWRLNASAQIRRAVPAPTQGEDLSTVQARCQETMTVEACYDSLEKLGLSFGPRFRGVTGLWRQDGEVLGRMELPEMLAAEAVAYQYIHPAFLDACFHGLGAALPEAGRQLSVAYLLLGLDEVRFYSRPGTPFWNHIRLRSEGDLAALTEQETFTADMRLFDEAGALVAELSGLRLKRAHPEMLLRSIPDRVQDLLYEIAWLPQPHPAATLSAAAENWLIFADSQGVGQKLAAELQARGQQTTLVVPGETYRESSDNQVQLNPFESSDFVRLFQQRPYRGVVYLWGLDNHLVEETTARGLQEAQRLTTGGVLHLVQAMVKTSETDAPHLWLVTRGAQATGGDFGPTAAGQAAILGLSRTVALEHPELNCRRIDLNPQVPEDEVQTLLAEIWQRNAREEEIVFREERRVRRLVRSSVKQIEPISFSAESSYLVTGGLRGLGLLVAEWLVERGARHLVLMGRSGISAAGATLDKLKQAGVQIMVAQGDVSCYEDVARILTEVGQAMPPLRGIIHCAGVLDDGILLQQNWARFETVMAPKVTGSWHLHTLTRHLPLDFFVMFSSGASMLGSAGQGNYGAANAFMDALAGYRRSQGLPAASINWGAWATVGMAAERNLADARGIATLTPQEGLQALGLAIQQSFTQLGVLPADWPQLLAPFATGEEPSLYREIACELNRHKAKALPAAQEEPALLQKLADVLPNKRKALLLAHVRQQAAQVLGLNGGQAIATGQPLQELGLDSLMAVELRNKLAQSVKETLPATLLFECPTINALVDYLADEVLALETAVPPTADTFEVQATGPEMGAETETSGLNDLSDDELAALLMAKLDQIDKG